MTAAQFKDGSLAARRRGGEEARGGDAGSTKEAAESARRAEVAATAAAIAAFTPTPAPTGRWSSRRRRPGPRRRPRRRVPAREIPPAILKVVKPVYPPVALQARIGGLVILRVLVSETGQPIEIEVVRAATAGLTEAAVAAVEEVDVHARPQGRHAGAGLDDGADSFRAVGASGTGSGVRAAGHSSRT